MKRLNTATLLRSERERASLSQDRLARRLAISQSTLSRYESGEAVLPAEVVHRAAQVLRSPRLEVQLCFECPAGILQVPWLDRVDTHPQAVLHKMVEELEEARDAVNVARRHLVNKASREQLTAEDLRALEGLEHEIADLCPALYHTLAVLAESYAVDLSQISSWLYSKCRSRGYLSYSPRVRGHVRREKGVAA
ncbi:MAG: helix-turn-helix transcriptional regulator [bacterium]|nr:helix-turn-helix transcriptional regulator [bacterium]